MVGVEDLPFAPHYSLDGEGQYRGFAREVLDAFAVDSGVSLSYKALPGDQWLPALQRGEISPGKNALRPYTTAEFTPLRLGHKSFANSCPLALPRSAFYPVLVHRLIGSLHAAFPRSVALPQLRFTSFAVASSRGDLHPQERAHAGRTKNSSAVKHCYKKARRRRMCNRIPAGDLSVCELLKL